MVNSKFSFYLVYFKPAIYVFVLIPVSSDAGTGKVGGGNTFVSRYFFLIENVEYFAGAFIC